MDKAYWRMKKREQRLKAKGVEMVVVRPLPGAPEAQVVAEWDAGKYPVKEAFEVAVARAERARRYALKFSDLVRKGDEKYQDIGWQYENEGLKAVRKAETHLVK